MYWADILEILLNVLEAITVVVSVVTFFVLMLNKFLRGLKYIFAPCGLGFFNRFRVLVVCRKSYEKKRAFIEYALLKTQGHAVISSEWKSIINGFKGFYSDNGSELIYTIPNCTLLIDSELNKAVGRYFNFLSNPKVKKTFCIRDEELKWVIKIRIEEAYATPTCLLTGLLSIYEESWVEFIKKYVSSAYISEASNSELGIIPSELYMLFAWLLWGPSYEIDYKKYWAGLCQLSYGDESNSIPVLANMDSDVIDRLRDKFQANEGNRYGALMSVDLSVFEKKSRMRDINELVNPANAYFYDKIKDDGTSFVAQIDDFIPCMNYKSKKYYCTAYVWLLFELEDPTSVDFYPERSVAFFEHANLTDNETYKFLIGTLIDKSIKHFEGIFSDGNYANRKYRFVAALNSSIEEECRARFKQIAESNTALGEQFSKRIIMEPKRKASMAFAAFDEYFTKSDEYQFVEVSLDNNRSIADLGQFYTNVYMECFPDVNERETFDNLLSYLRQAQGQDEYTYHIILLKDNDKVIGGAIFDYFKRTNSAIIEFIAIKSDMQSAGLGTLIFKKIQLMLSYQDNRFNKRNVDNIFCEIDSPAYSTASVKKYLYFWNKNNFKHVNFNYVQPALSNAQMPVRGLWLAVLTDNREPTISVELVKNILFDYMKYCMHIDNPHQNAEYVEMARELDGKDGVELLSIIPKQA